MEVLKSTNYKQEDLIADIITLHIPEGCIEADITYSKGQFYKNKIVKEPVFKFDKYPVTDDTILLDYFFSSPDESYSSIMCDLPFVISRGKSLENFKKGSNIISSRFSSFESPELLFDCYGKILSECYKKLKENGILIFKTQGTVSGGKNYLTDFWSISKAIEIGFYCKDVGVLIAKQRLNSGKIKTQQHLRKYHSYFLVFQKKRKPVIDYASF